MVGPWNRGLILPAVFKNLAFLLWMDSEQLLSIVFHLPSPYCTSMQGLLVLASRRSDGSPLSFPPLPSFPSALVTRCYEPNTRQSEHRPRSVHTKEKRGAGREKRARLSSQSVLGAFSPLASAVSVLQYFLSLMGLHYKVRLWSSFYAIPRFIFKAIYFLRIT